MAAPARGVGPRQRRTRRHDPSAPDTGPHERLMPSTEQPWLGVGLPAVGAVEADTPALQAFQHSFEGGGVTTPQLPVDEASRSTIPSLPDPELVRLFFRKCHISSSSTTTARPSGSGSGFWAYTSAKRSIQAWTLG